MKISYKRSAEKELFNLEKSLIQRVHKKIGALATGPYPFGGTKLGGGKGYRIRVGDHRVTYTVDKENDMILIVRIRHRKEVYKDL